MDATKNHLADRIKQRFLAFRERHNEMHTRYVSTLPMMQARDMQDTQQILQRFRAQPQKNVKTKQYDLHKQLKAGPEQSTVSSDMNGTFNNNNEMLKKVSQKRAYEQFKGTNGIVDDSVSKIARIAENAKYQQQQQQHPIKASSYDMNPNLQPNVNPFQQQQNFSATVVNNKAANQPLSTSSIDQPVSITNTSVMTSNTNIKKGNENANQTPKLGNMSPSRSSVKTEVNNTPSNASSCGNPSKPQNLINLSKNESSNNIMTNSAQQYQQQQYTNDNSLRGLGDLDNLNSYELFGEITGNTRKNVKSEDHNEKSKINTSNSASYNNNTSMNQQHQSSWKDLSKPATTSNSNIVLTSITTSVSSTNNPLTKLMKAQPLQQQNMNGLPNINQSSPLSSLNQLTSNVQNNRLITSTNNKVNNAPVNMNQMMSLPNINNTARNPIMSQQAINNMATNNVLSRQAPNNIASSVNSTSTMNMNPNLKQTHNISLNSTPNNQMPNPVPPPNLQRTTNLRQKIADRLKTPQQQQQQQNPQQQQQQQQQQTMMQNMQQNLNNPFIHTSVPSTAEKLQEHLKRREHFRILQMQQQQMPKSPFMTHPMMSSPIQSQLQQNNPFQFPNDYTNYNQQMGMQSAQPNMAYYQQMYGMENGPFPGTAPPGYSQPNRAGAMLRNYIRDRQQMNEMYNPNIGNIRPGLNQTAMFNTPNKAPPQYQHQALSQSPVDPQQIMLNNNTAVAVAGMQSRLSHFSQPDNMGMSSSQMRLRGNMNPMSRYPAPPNLSRPDTMSQATSQFNNQFPNNQINPNMRVMNPNQQTFNQNWSNEQQQQQQQLLMLRKERLEAHQRQHLMNLQQQQRLQQQQQLQDPTQQRQPNTMLDNIGATTNDIRFNTNNTTKYNTTPDVAQSVGDVNASNHNLVSDNQTAIPVTTSSSSNDTIINDNVSNLTIDSTITDNTNSIDQDTSSIDSILPGSAEDLDNFLNNPNENFDLVAMF